MSLDPLVEEADAGSEVFPYSTNQADHVYPTLVISSSNGIILINKTTDFGTSTSANFGLSSANPTRAGEKVTSSAYRNVKMKWAEFYLSTFGSPTGSVTCKIRKTSDDSIIATSSDTVDSATIPAVATLYRFNFSSEITPNEEYRIQIEFSGGNGSNLVRVHYHTSDVSADGISTRYSGTYTDDGTIDITLKINVDDFITFSDPNSAKDNNLITFWFSLSEIQPFLRGEFSALADQEPAQIAIYVDKSKITVLQFLIQTSPDGTIWTTKRTVNISQLADLQYNFIRFNRDILPIRFIRIIGNDSTAKVFSISEFKALIPDSVQWADRQAHKTISTTGIVGLSG